MEEFLRRRAVSLIAAFAAKPHTCRAAANHHANRSTVAKKVGRLTAAGKTTQCETLTVNRNPCDQVFSKPQPRETVLYTAAEASR